MKEYDFQNTDETIRLLTLVRQVMPRDTAAMMTLFEVLKFAGEEEQAIDLLTLLVRTVLAKGQQATAQSVLFMVSQVHSPRPELQRLTDPLRQLAASSTAEDFENRSALKERGDNLAPQVELLWKLYGIGEIERHEYVMLLEHMADLSARNSGGPLSAFQVMEELRVGEATRALQVVASDAGMPPINLDLFSISEDHLARLPPAYWRKRGVMPFGELADQLMVAVLNPSDTRLVADVQNEAGTRCHFFVTDHDGYVRALEKAEGAWNVNASDAPPEPLDLSMES